MQMTEKVAILMATYNGSLYVAEQIDSLLSQSYKDWILFIHDDGSMDGTLDIIENYHAKYPDKIQIIQGEKTGGAKENFLFLLKNIKAPYIMLADQDDVWQPEKIETSLNRMKSQESVFGQDKPHLVFTDLSVVDTDLHVIAETMSKYQGLNPRKTKLNNIIIQNVIPGCTLMINNAMLDYVNKISETDSIIMHDWWLALIAAQYGTIDYIANPMMLYRQHSTNSVGTYRFWDLEYLKNKLIKSVEIKKELLVIEKQAEYFVKIYGLQENKMLSSFAVLHKQSKISRIRFHMRYHVWKNGIIRNIGLIVFG